jgi:hypothetical protein
MGGGVTYRRTNDPSFSRNVRLSKEIEKSRCRAARTRVSTECVVVFGREKELGKKR